MDELYIPPFDCQGVANLMFQVEAQFSVYKWVLHSKVPAIHPSQKPPAANCITLFFHPEDQPYLQNEDLPSHNPIRFAPRRSVS